MVCDVATSGIAPSSLDSFIKKDMSVSLYVLHE